MKFNCKDLRWGPSPINVIIPSTSQAPYIKFVREWVYKSSAILRWLQTIEKRYWQDYHKRKRLRFNITLFSSKSEDGFLITVKADIFASSYSFSLSFSLVESSSPLSKWFSSLYIQLYCISALHLYVSVDPFGCLSH